MFRWCRVVSEQSFLSHSVFRELLLKLGRENISCSSLTEKKRLQFGYIAQWLERLTADQQVPGSNPGVPCFNTRPWFADAADAAAAAADAAADADVDVAADDDADGDADDDTDDDADADGDADGDGAAADAAADDADDADDATADAGAGAGAGAGC